MSARRANRRDNQPHPRVSHTIHIQSRDGAVRIGNQMSWLIALAREVSQIEPDMDMTRLVNLMRAAREGRIYPEPKKLLEPTLCPDIQGIECCVCMDAAERENVRRFGCNHETCLTCFNHIYNSTAKCPLCRADIMQVSRAPDKKVIRVKKLC